METNKGLKFQPWIGNEYGENNSDRLLLLGESHYLQGEENHQSDFTTQVVTNFLNDEQMETPYFKRINLLFNQDKSFWDKIAFANLIQSGLDVSKSQPTEEDLSTIAPAYKILLNTLKPNKVVVLSKRMWDYWIPFEGGIEIIPKKPDSIALEVWQYEYDGGTCLATGIKHPSRLFGNSYKEWIPVIKKFMAM